MKKLSLLFLLTIHLVSFGQTKFTVSGTITDKSKGETVIGARVKIKDKNQGAVSNEYGFYSLTLPEGNYTLIISALGYENQEKEIQLTENLRIDFIVATPESKTQEIQEVKVTGVKQDANVKSAIMGVEKLDPKAIAKIPVLLGEKDIIKTMQLLPGVKSAGEGNSGYYVRGGGSDQNLILLDEAPVYNASHLLGFFSTFNSDAIKDATLYKGNQAANFGGRLSSVLDIKMNEGNNQRFNVSGGLGLISSKLNVEGPIVKDKASFLITGRRTYADVFLKATDDFKDNTLYFYDLNAKLNYKLGQKDRLFLSGYFGRDKLGFGTNFGINWGNATGTVRWNHLINSKLFSNTSLIYSSYDYEIAIKSNEVDFTITSKVLDYNIKQEFQYFPNSNNKIKFGFNVINHNITPGQLSGSKGIQSNLVFQKAAKSLESAAYASNDWDVNEFLSVNYGVRMSAFSLLGNGQNSYTYTASGAVDKTLTYADNAHIKTYINWEPRISFSYAYQNDASFKMAYSRNTQNIHLVSNSTTSSPTDTWLGTSLNTKPEIADQASFGWFKNFEDNMYEFNVETYYKQMQNQIDYRNGANTQANEKLEGELLYGDGRAYGLELILKKKTGRFNGWISYCLSKSERKIEGINSGNWYNAKQDRTHDVSIVGIYDLTPKLSISALFVFYTGNAITFPSGKYSIEGQSQFLYTTRNGSRMPNYHRLDLGVNWVRKNTDKYESSWNFSIYNAYGRENAYTIAFREKEGNPNVTEAVQTSLFRWIPAITYNFKFK
ncbi:MAG: TonB-dependent receptor [Crocinitomicaceae bacterium]|nr:TonB-dependent receptor [Crocinitomicaceae bacterium]